MVLSVLYCVGIIIDAEFSELQNNFCREYCDIFVEDDENKIEYTKVFNRYTRTIESYIEERLQQVMPEFQMDRFARMCHKVRDRDSNRVDC